ncbi:MAG: hypothetical protein CBE49_003590 [Rickettsiales bacterium TMED289]|nr:MAG: hypothetical protein CBE49_003590 [Rickettsiales bacterium TMED289]
MRLKQNIYFIIFLIWTIISSLFIFLNPENDYFVFTGLIKNLLRFTMIIYIFTNIRYLLWNHYLLNYAINLWIKVIYFICILGFVEYFLQFFGIYYSYYFEGITTTTSRQLSESFRISSIFNEPSYLVIYLNFSLLTISEFFKRNKTFSKKTYVRLLITIFITTAIAQSLVGVVLFLYIIFIYRNRIFDTNNNQLFVLFSISVFTILLFYLNIERLQRISEFQDGSSNHRLLGSFELANKIFQSDYVITGVGIGQHKHFLINKSYVFDYHFFMKSVSRNSGVNNMFTLIFFQTGIIGLFIYLVLLFNIFKKRKSIFLFYLISGFGWAFTFNPLYWFSISILHLLINAKQKNPIHIN